MEDMITEIWKPVLNNPHLEVSNLGRIKRLKGRNKGIQSHFCLDKDGYCKISVLNEFGKWTQTSVHRIVALAFIPNPDNKPFVDHIDGNRTNNVASNLRWVTPEENANNELTKRNVYIRKNKTALFDRPVVAISLIDGSVKEYNSIAEA